MDGWKGDQSCRGAFHTDFSNSAKKFWARASAEGEACCCKVMTVGPSVACSEIFGDEVGSGTVFGGCIGSNLAKTGLRRERRAGRRRKKEGKKKGRGKKKGLAIEAGNGRDLTRG